MRHGVGRWYHRTRTRYGWAAWVLGVMVLSSCGGRQQHVQTPVFHLPPPTERMQSSAAQTVRAGATQANLIIILLDAARADHFSHLGYQYQTTPYVRALCKQGLALTRAFAPSASTKPSVTSLFTSQYPDTHGTLSLLYQMTPSGATLAECLRAAGFSTLAISGTPAVSLEFGFGRGFTSFIELFREVGKPASGGKHFRTGTPGVDGARVVQAATQWIDAHATERFFAYLHFREPHSPYGAPRKFFTPVILPDGKRIRRILSPYDSGLAYADWLIGQLVQHLRTRRLLDKTVIVVLADHGEAFGEHGQYGHSKTVYREMVQIPVVISLPAACRAVPARRDEIFCTVDLMPTLLDLFRIPAPATMQGRSRLALLSGELETVPSFAVSRAVASDDTGGTEKPQGVSYTLREAQYTLMLADQGRRVKLFDAVADPEEKHSIAEQQPAVVARLRQDFEVWAATQRGRPVVLDHGCVYTVSAEPAKMSEDTRRQLQDLGYLK